MRQIATVPNAQEVPYRIMLYAPEDDSGVYLFLFRSLEDGACYADYWFEAVEKALECARQEYGVEKTHWQAIPDPSPGCQHDWIAPIRVVRDSRGYPIQPVQFELL